MLPAEKNNNKSQDISEARAKEEKIITNAESHFFKHYGKADEMYSGGLQHVSGFMSVTLDQ